jgi:hypothetical protein
MSTGEAVALAMSASFSSCWLPLEKPVVDVPHKRCCDESKSAQVRLHTEFQLDIIDVFRVPMPFVPRALLAFCFSIQER